MYIYIYTQKNGPKTTKIYNNRSKNHIKNLSKLIFKPISSSLDRSKSIRLYFLSRNAILNFQNIQYIWTLQNSKYIYIYITLYIHLSIYLSHNTYCIYIYIYIYVYLYLYVYTTKLLVPRPAL